MITFEVFVNKSGDYTWFRSRGHAQDAESGQSVVCAWVSAVTQVALLGLTEEAKIPVSQKLDKKKGLLEVKLCQAPDERSRLILRPMVLVLEQLAKKCPKDVRFREHGGESTNV